MSLVSLPPIPTGDDKGPTNEIGYATAAPLKWSMWTSETEENAAELRWPRSIQTLHRMRTDAQVDGLWRAVTLPIRRSRWVIDPNGARDEVVERMASNFNLPIRGVEDPPPRRARGFSYGDHLRQSLLGGIYGFMFFEMSGLIDDGGMWKLERLGPRMPSSIKDIQAADNGDLKAIVQWPRSGDPMTGRPIPGGWVVPYVWDMEGGNWLGRSMLRSSYKYWLLKDRLLRVDAIKHERFGAGIPYAGAPPGATRDTVQRYGALARSMRADTDAGVGLPHGGDIGVEGIRGTLPDTLASIQYYDEQMARAFLAMILMLGGTGTKSGSRALGESFVDFFKMGVDAVAEWHRDTTNTYVIDRMVDWNFGPDETVPLLDWDEDPESRMNATDLVSLIDSGAIVVDDELRTWISDRWGVSDPGDGTPTPPGPSPSTAGVPQPTPGEPAPPTTPAAASRRVAASRVTHGVSRPTRRTHRRQTPAARRVSARSQTAHTPRIGHRDPTQVELAAKTDFAKVQQQWADHTTALVDAYKASVRTQQITELVAEVEDAVAAGDVDALVSVMASTDGATLISQGMMAMLEDAIVTAKDEASGQGVTIGLLDTSAVGSTVDRLAGGVADLLLNAVSQTAANQAFQRYGVTNVSGTAVADHVRTHLENLSDAYLTDQLGGAMTQAQNAGRVLVMSQAPGTYYASELLDENTCEECAAEDGTTFDTIDDALADYPAGGYSECAGGPRCRGTVVAVYDEASSEGSG